MSKSKLIPNNSLNETTKLNNNIQMGISELKQYLLGRVLTLIDGTIPNEQQCKAIKDIVKDIFWSKEYFTEQIENDVFHFFEENCPKLLENLEGWERNNYEDYKKRNITPTINNYTK